MRLQISPEPSPEEAAAIEMALALLAARGQAGPRRLRYDDVAPAGPRLRWQDGSSSTSPPPTSSWSGLARRESVDGGV